MKNHWLRLKLFPLFFLFPLFPLFLPVITPPAWATSPEPVPYQIKVSAAIGEPKLTLFGYTSPHAQVELKGFRVFERTLANSDGYFVFDRIFLPPPKQDVFLREVVYPELCLMALDTQGLTSFPLCLPPLPSGPFDIKAGPVLLPPTLTLEKGSFYAETQITARGQTIPNSQITIYLANNSSGEPGLIHFFSNFLASPVQAYSLPEYKIEADQAGHFEFNLPAVQPATWKLFAATTYLESPSPKSNSLTFKIMGFWEWLWEELKKILGAIFGLIRPYLFFIILLVEAVIIGYLLRARKGSMKAHPDSLR